MLRQGNLFFGWSLHPRGRPLLPERSEGGNKDPEGKKATQKKGLSDEAKFSRGISILYNGVNFLAFEPSFRRV